MAPPIDPRAVYKISSYTAGHHLKFNLFYQQTRAARHEYNMYTRCVFAAPLPLHALNSLFTAGREL